MLWSTLNTLLCKTFVISSLPTSSPPHRRCCLVLLHIYIDDEQTYILTWLKKTTYYYCYHYHNRQLNSTQQPNNYCWYATKQPTTNSRVVPPTVPLLLLLQCSPMCTYIYIYMQFCMFTFVTNPIYTKSPCNSATTFGNITNTSTTTTTTTNKQHLLVIWTKWKQNLQYFVMHCVLFCLLDNDDDGPEDGC